MAAWLDAVETDHMGLGSARDAAERRARLLALTQALRDDPLLWKLRA